MEGLRQPDRGTIAVLGLDPLRDEDAWPPVMGLASRWFRRE